MSGWLGLLLLAAIALGAARATARLDRGAVMLIASALCVAAAGYAWQGRPGLPGAPRRDAGAIRRDETLFAIERGRLMRAYSEPAQWLVVADALNRTGDDRGAAQLLQTQSRRHPRDVPLAVGYAHALLVFADYNVTPAVALAFERAIAIAPHDPAPPFFLGLAQFEARDLDGSERTWRTLRDRLPPTSPWRAVIAERLKLFDVLRAMGKG